jgi:hypothetical protein
VLEFVGLICNCLQGGKSRTSYFQLRYYTARDNIATALVVVLITKWNTFAPSFSKTDSYNSLKDNLALLIEDLTIISLKYTGFKVSVLR